MERTTTLRGWTRGMLAALVAVGHVSCAAGAPARRGEDAPVPAGTSTQRLPLPEGAVRPGAARVGDRTVCPVSDDFFVVQADSPRVEHEGRTYFVCCDHCVDEFRGAPGKFSQRE